MNKFHNMENKMPVKVVGKALGLLEAVVEAELRGRPAVLGELAEEAGMPVSSAHNLLKTLAACGYVQQEVRGCYQPGPRFRQWGRLNRLGSSQNRPAVLEAMKQFVAAEQEPCVLVSLAGGDRVVLAHLDCEQAVRVSHATLSDEPFFSVPTGRLLAAMASEAELKQIIDRHGLPGKDWGGIKSESALRKALAALRDEGVCVITAEPQGTVAMATTVCGEDENLRCVLGAYAPLFRCDEKRRAALMKTLKRTARTIETILQEEPR